MSDQRHVIKQQVLELEIEAHLDAVALQTHISQLYRQQVVPLIDSYCSQLSDPEVIQRLDRLEIDLGDIDLASLNTDYVAKAAEAIATALTQRLSQPSPSSPLSSSSPPLPTRELQPLGDRRLT